MQQPCAGKASGLSAPTDNLFQITYITIFQKVFTLFTDAKSRIIIYSRKLEGPAPRPSQNNASKISNSRLRVINNAKKCQKILGNHKVTNFKKVVVGRRRDTSQIFTPPVRSKLSAAPAASLRPARGAGHKIFCIIFSRKLEGPALRQFSDIGRQTDDDNFFQISYLMISQTFLTLFNDAKPRIVNSWHYHRREIDSQDSKRFFSPLRGSTPANAFSLRNSRIHLGLKIKG